MYALDSILKVPSFQAFRIKAIEFTLRATTESFPPEAAKNILVFLEKLIADPQVPILQRQKAVQAILQISERADVLDDDALETALFSLKKILSEPVFVDVRANTFFHIANMSKRSAILPKTLQLLVLVFSSIIESPHLLEFRDQAIESILRLLEKKQIPENLVLYVAQYLAQKLIDLQLSSEERKNAAKNVLFLWNGPVPIAAIETLLFSLCKILTEPTFLEFREAAIDKILRMPLNNIFPLNVLHNLSVVLQQIFIDSNLSDVKRIKAVEYILFLANKKEILPKTIIVFSECLNDIRKLTLFYDFHKTAGDRIITLSQRPEVPVEAIDVLFRSLCYVIIDETEDPLEGKMALSQLASRINIPIPTVEKLSCLLSRFIQPTKRLPFLPQDRYFFFVDIYTCFSQRLCSRAFSLAPECETVDPSLVPECEYTDLASLLHSSSSSRVLSHETSLSFEEQEEKFYKK